MNNIPKILPKRNEFGLLETIDYIFNDDGTVNYKEMLFQHPEFLVPNRKNFEKRGQKAPEDIKDIEDKDLLILLAGVKWVSALRGYTSVEQYVFSSNSEFVSGKCRINWIGNFETSNQSIIFEDTADASVHNTSGFGKVFLTTICGNRAFVRNVRNFLRIPILGSDEISADNMLIEEQPKSQSLLQPTEILSKLLKDKNISFNDAIKGMKDSENWKSIETMPKAAIFSVIGKLKLNK